jgi:PST family polysaccharide transporter
MSTFKAALRGVSWALAAQVIAGVGQIAYSAITARIFSPYAFGEFTAALSLQGLISLCTATGVSSFVVKEAHIRRSQLRAINTVLFFVGSLGAAAYWFVSPLWLAWLNSPGGIQFVPLLAWATFVSPIASVQWALLRREGNGRADAMVYVSAFIVATVAAAFCAIRFRESWALALGVAINPIVQILFSRVIRRAVYTVEGGWLSFDWLVFALRVTGQSLVYFGLGQVPTWSLGASAAPATLGEFSRGNTLAQLPAHALGTAMNIGSQPHWRKIETDESRIRGVSDALVIGASVSFICFAALAALSRPLTALWLGPGWDLAAEFTAWLAIGFAMSLATGVLANYLEMAGELSRVYWIQFANAAGLALGVALLASLHDFRYLLAGFVLSHLLGLVTSVLQVSAALGTRSGQLFKQLVAPLISAIGVGSVAYACAHIVAKGIGGGTTLGDVAQLCGGGFAAILLVVLTRKWQPAFSILVARGVL